MPDRFGFNKISRRMNSVNRDFISDGIKLSQEEMKNNFETESANGSEWEDITYRDVPPPILDLTSELKNEAVNNTPSLNIGDNIAIGILTIDPIDPKKGKGYAEFHQQDGTGDTATKGSGDYGRNKMREFCTQSSELDEKQVNLLITKLDKAFL